MYALGVTMFIMPHKFVLGGLTGVAVLLNYGFGLPVSLMVLIMNALLLTISYKVLGTEFLIKTVISVVSLTVFLDRKSTRLNSSHVRISYAVFCLKKKKSELQSRPHLVCRLLLEKKTT